MKIAIVILNWNGKKWLEKFLPSVIAHSGLHPIYLADNASTDDSVVWVAHHYPAVQLIAMNKNRGYAGGYNEALKHVDEPLACLLNNDIEVTPQWLDNIVTRFINEPMLAALQPKIRDYNQREYFEYAGAAGGFLDRFAFPYCRGRIFNTIEIDHGQYDDPCAIDWASGAALFLRLTAYREVGGLDCDYFAHQEEVDLCWRLRLRGYHVGYEPQSTVYHVGGASLNTANPEKTFYNFRNSLFNIVKNDTSANWLFVLFTRMVLDGIAGLRFLAYLQGGHCYAVLHAHASFYRFLPKMLNKRKNLKDYGNLEKTKVLSIVFQYFALKRRRYSDF